MKYKIEIKKAVAPEKPTAKKETREPVYNLEFGIRNFVATQDKHASKIRTLKAKGIKYRDIISEYTEDNIISNIVSSTQWYYFYRGLFKDSVKKSNVRMLKTFVNNITRQEIQNNLEYEGISKYYDTAFYCSHYKQINASMKRITKEILKNYVGA